MRFTAEGSPYRQRTSPEQLQVFGAEPGGRLFTGVARINWDYVSATMEVQAVALYPPLKQKAEVASDAVVIREAATAERRRRGSPFRILADVIRWQP